MGEKKLLTQMWQKKKKKTHKPNILLLKTCLEERITG